MRQPPMMALTRLRPNSRTLSQENSPRVFKDARLYFYLSVATSAMFR